MTDHDDPSFIAIARFHEQDVPDEKVLDHIPTDPTDQSCACSSSDVRWVHPLARSRTRYRRFGKGWGLPLYWWLCAECETLYQDGDDAELVRRSAVDWREGLPPAEWYPDGIRPFTDREYYHQVYEQPFAVFRRADMGAYRVGYRP